MMCGRLRGIRHTVMQLIVRSGKKVVTIAHRNWYIQNPISIDQKRIGKEKKRFFVDYQN